MSRGISNCVRACSLFFYMEIDTFRPCILDGSIPQESVVSGGTSKSRGLDDWNVFSLLGTKNCVSDVPYFLLSADINRSKRWPRS